MKDSSRVSSGQGHTTPPRQNSRLKNGVDLFSVTWCWTVATEAKENHPVVENEKLSGKYFSLGSFELVHTQEFSQYIKF